MKLIRSLTLPCLMLLAACSVGPYEETERTAEPEGPGLFTGDKGQFSFDDYFEEKKKQRSGSYYGGPFDIPAIDDKSFEEFEAFKMWRRAKQTNSVEFKEYQEWQDYQEYRRYKAEKESAKP